MMRNESGQSLFELVVAIAISALIVIAIVSLVTNALKSANFSKNNAIATSLSQEVVEWLRAQRDSDIAGFLTRASASPDYCFITLDWSNPGVCASNDLIDNLFLRQGHFEVDTSSGITVVHVKITVFWSGTTSNHEVINNTDFTDWRQR